MVSRIMFPVFALSFISFGSGYLVKRTPDPFKEVMGCFKIALDNSQKELQKGNIGDAICYYKWMNPCVRDLELTVPTGSRLWLDLVVASLWQELAFVHKVYLCLNYSTADLKSYALKSGVMKKLDLHNIENDEMKPCAQRAILDCAFGTSWNGMFASMFEPLFNCVKGKTCKAPIWQHFLETVVAFEEEFKKHREKFNEYFLKIQA
ncbi:uncharacterized protein [Porites lutea]|uniref:uncharacterized protein n=1 Tax=Porites lutea TaxID=51062 RepID=UPI003CC62C00